MKLNRHTQTGDHQIIPLPYLVVTFGVTFTGYLTKTNFHGPQALAGGAVKKRFFLSKGVRGGSQKAFSFSQKLSKTVIFLSQTIIFISALKNRVFCFSKALKKHVCSLKNYQGGSQKTSFFSQTLPRRPRKNKYFSSTNHVFSLKRQNTFFFVRWPVKMTPNVTCELPWA